jgi:hypothetical protein
MVGIAQDNLRTDLLNLRRRHPFDRRLRAHGHENGGLDITVPGLENPTPRLTVFFEQCKH